jgi:hypothetical protein
MTTIPIERIIAVVCLTLIAFMAMLKLSDPENIVINIVVGIVAFIGGRASTTKK